MQAVDRELLSVLGDPTIRFVVPVYQRAYAWEKEHWERLWQDIMAIAATDKQHFTGSIVWVARIQGPGENSDGNVLVDGQQRLTTLSLIILAYAEYAKKHGNKSANAKDLPVSHEELLEDKYILSRSRKGEQRYKLTLSDVDRATFRALSESLVSPDTPIPDSDSRLVKALDYFRAKIAGMEDQGMLWEGLKRLSIVNVTLNPLADNPQLVFESMNATGKRLDDADLIRNYILMGLPIDEQNKYYANYWRQIELTLGTDANNGIFDQFIFHYLTLCKAPALINQSDIYRIFQDYKNTCGLSTEELLREMLFYAKIYASITLPREEKDNEIAEIFNNIEILRANPFLPLLMLFYAQREKYPDKFSRDEFVATLKIIETYLVYRALCEYSSNSFNKFAPSLIARFRDVFDADDFRAAKHLLASLEDEKSTVKEFPSANQVMASLENKNFYKLAPNRRKFFMDRLENSFHPKNRLDIFSGNYTVEHIMPQSIDPESAWPKMLGEDYENWYQDCLHLLGNLTMTAYNSELGNMSFADKKRKYLETEPIAMTKDVIAQEEWTFEKIKERTKKLSERFMQIWPRPCMGEAEIKEYALMGKDADLPSTFITVKDLITKNLLMPGEKLETHKGSIYSEVSCVLDESGNFIFEDGKIAESPSGAAKYAAKMRGRQISAPNGWTFWHVPRLDCKLSDVRSQFYSSSND